MIKTTTGVSITDKLIYNYFDSLVNSFFKILPMREDNEATLPIYIRSLQIELLGYKELIYGLNNNPKLLTLIAILQYLYDNPHCSVKDVKREVFKAIGICNKLKNNYAKVV